MPVRHDGSHHRVPGPLFHRRRHRDSDVYFDPRSGPAEMAKFGLHERLAADTIEVTRWPLSIVLLMNARQWPWLILVPRRAEIREIHELQEPDQCVLMAEIVRAARALTQLVKPHKINIGALGNMVPQLHVHVIARFTDDPAWPKPVWGAIPPESYADDELLQRVEAFNRALADC
jgi:diadenosine tetraphosphate (Ap4A) HIT family hydrolase